MYTILVDKNNNLITTEKQTIMQRSKLVDTLCFLTDPLYNAFDMTASTVLLEYVRPVSRKYETEILALSAVRYEGYLQYHLPVDTKLTSEAGDIELTLSFLYVDLDADGNPVQRVRKTFPTVIKVHPVSAWADIIPDEALSSIDQRILKTDAQIRALEEMSVLFDLTKADDLSYNDETAELQLMSGDTPIGRKVTLPAGGADQEAIEEAVQENMKDGVPVVAFDADSDDDGFDTDGDTDIPDDSGEIDNVVDFSEKNNVVTF